MFMFAMATQIVISRALGPEGKGLYSLAWLTAIAVVTLTHGYLSAANSHFAGRYPVERPALVGNSFLISGVWGTAVVVITYTVVFRFRGGIIPELNSHLWLMVLAAIIPLILFECSNGIIMGLDWMRRFSLILTLRKALLFFGVLLLWLIGRISVESAIAMWLASSIISPILQMGSAWCRINWRIKVSIPLLKRVIAFVAQAHAANVFTFLTIRVDMFLIAYFLTIKEVGYYSIAIGMTETIKYLPTAISHVLIPYISKRDNQAGDKITPRLSRLGLTISFLVAIFLAIVGSLLIKVVFGEAFLPAYPALLLLLPGAVIYTLATMLAGDLIGRGLPKYAMYISMITLITNVAVNLILIPRFGIVGAAISSSITQSLTGFMFLYAFLRESQTPVLETLVIRRNDIKDVIKAIRHR